MKKRLVDLTKGDKVEIDDLEMICVFSNSNIFTHDLVFYSNAYDTIYNLTVDINDMIEVEWLVEGSDVEMIGYDAGDFYID